MAHLYFESAYLPVGRAGSPITMDSWRRWRSACGTFHLRQDRWSKARMATRLLVEGARRLRESTDRAIVGVFGGNLMEWGQILYRNDNFLALLAAEPDRAHDFLERLTEFHMKSLEKFLGLVGPYVDVVVLQRRPRDADRPADLPADVPRVLQASPRSAVAARQGAG